MWRVAESIPPSTGGSRDTNPRISPSSTGGSPANPPGSGGSSSHFNKKQLNRKANLGTMIQMLQLRVPEMLQHLIPEAYVSKSIVLRVLPHLLTGIPPLKGYLLYSTTLKAFQMALTSFYLDPKTKMHISSIKVDEPTSSLSSDELVNLSINDTIVEHAKASQKSQVVSHYTTKVIVKWRTCLRNCPHLKEHGKPVEKSNFDKLDFSKLLPSGKLPSTLIYEMEKKVLPEFLRRGSKDSGEKVITGVFVFELTAQNDRIAVLTIDNCDILEGREGKMQDVGFAPQA